jgi:cellulose synthase/poly-beta-1,6-N-acetylglucosamine synthase-like glycosyltransferase
MKISILIPCYNEERSIKRSVLSWLSQTRPADEIIVIDDCSNDRTAEILEEFKGRVTVVRTPQNSGNKSSAQEYGLQFVTGDIFIATDGDTLLDARFVECIEKDFADPSVAAVGGYVKSLKYNWLTACRALDYAIGQNIDKLAQHYLHFMLVIPGAAGAFRTDIFRTLGFDHDTITEDLDFTYKLHKRGYNIVYDRNAICYTQDPGDLHSYINQMRRWLGGGWQNFVKHIDIPKYPGMSFELSLVYGEGLIYSLMIFIIPILNLSVALWIFVFSLLISFLLAIVGVFIDRRSDLFFIIPVYVLLKYVTAYIFLEQFVKEVILRKREMVWFKPERVSLDGLSS